MDYTRSLQGIDKMIYSREHILCDMERAFKNPIKSNCYSWATHHKLITHGMKTLRECDKLKAIRSELYFLQVNATKNV